MEPLSTGESAESAAERKRITLACQVCKKRKIRCDGNPEKCENCKGFGTECIYVETGVKRGPPKGFKLKRKRSHGTEDADVVPSRPSKDTRPRDPPTPGSPIDPGNRGSSRGRRSDSSRSPPPRSTTTPQWSATRTGTHRELPAAAPLNPDVVPGGRMAAAGETGQGHGRDSGSPDVGFAVSALESLSDERYYRARPPSTGSPIVERERRDDVNTEMNGPLSPPGQHITATLQPPQSIPQPGLPSVIHSVPTSSRNSEDGMAETRGDDAGGQGDGSAGRVHIDRHTQDRLLAIYWTHIHNVWPLLYKPEFYPSTVHKPLLLAMLAAASAIPTPGKTILNSRRAEQLFEQAQDAVLIRHHHATPAPSRPPASTTGRDQFHEISPGKSSLQTVQCLILFSLRQTSNGNKSSAYLWFCHAAAMALELGLHRVVLDKSKHVSQAEVESRCRVFWTCYVLDKSFSEEMGRPVLLRASTASTPLPSALEADEYELWPPPSVSLGQSSRSRSRSKGDQLHIQPMKSRTITCFNATVRLAHIVEQCLDLDNELLMVPSASMPESRQLYVMDETTRQEEISRIERQKEQLAGRLVDWWNRLDPDLQVDTASKVCPPIHFVVNCSWFYSATIFLHSKNIGPKPPAGVQSERYEISHRICSEAAGEIVALLRCLDNFKILAPASSDIIHMLSHAALFHAYNAAIPQNEFAASAEANFQQCCLWLQEIGSFWAPASVQRQFFEGLVKGGKELTAKHRTTTSQPAASQPLSSLRVLSPTQLLQRSPAMSNSFSQGSPRLAQVTQQPGGPIANQTAITNVPDSSDLFRVRSHFWNEFLPNAEQFQADRRGSDLGTFATNISEDLGSLYDLSAFGQSSSSGYPGAQSALNEDDLNMAAFATLAQPGSGGFPASTSRSVGSTTQAVNTVDPSDWLVAYMLDSIQQSRP